MAKCPICLAPNAISLHHIKPSSDGGNNTHKNKIRLCKRCHDIVEDIYNNTGAELSTDMITLIRLEYKFPETVSVNVSVRESILHYTTKSLRRNIRRRFRYAEEKISVTAGDVAIRCFNCNGWHLPNKRGFIVCPKYKNEKVEYIQPLHDPKIDAFYNRLREKLVNMNSS